MTSRSRRTRDGVVSDFSSRGVQGDYETYIKKVVTSFARYAKGLPYADLADTAGEVIEEPQDDSQATYAPKIERDMGDPRDLGPGEAHLVAGIGAGQNRRYPALGPLLVRFRRRAGSDQGEGGEDQAAHGGLRRHEGPAGR